MPTPKSSPISAADRKVLVFQSEAQAQAMADALFTAVAPEYAKPRAGKQATVRWDEPRQAKDGKWWIWSPRLKLPRKMAAIVARRGKGRLSEVDFDPLVHAGEGEKA